MTFLITMRSPKVGNGSTEEDTKVGLSTLSSSRILTTKGLSISALQVERWRKGRRIGDGALEAEVTSLSADGSNTEANLIPE